MGSVETHGFMVSYLADRLKPESYLQNMPLHLKILDPAGIKDFLKVFKHLQQQNESLKLFVIGDSAGGEVLLSSLAMMRDMNLSQPAGIILISPWFDLECTADSYEINQGNDPIFTKTMIQQYVWLLSNISSDASQKAISEMKGFIESLYIARHCTVRLT